jgi:uncharacterized protein CbrC (UPF0167 family)
MIKCRYCDKEFTTEQACNSHIGKSHSNSQIFMPSKDMLTALKASFDMDTKPTIAAIMDKVSVDRTTWYTWIKNPGFVKWWTEMWQEYMRSQVFHLDKISYMKAASDFRYMELLQNKYANFSKKLDITSGGEKLSAGIFIDDDEDI